MAHAIFSAILGVLILLLIFPNGYYAGFDYSDRGGTTLDDLLMVIKGGFQELESAHESLFQNIAELQDGLRHLQEGMEAQSTQQCSSKNELQDLEVLVRTDECASGSHNCSYRASCENDLVGYTCNCLNGYSGDGFICEEKCWSPKSSQFVGIFGGHDAVQFQFPYMVALDIQFDNIEVQNCGGTILSDTWILTAGHCLQQAGKTVTNMIVRYDGVARNQMSTTSNIANYVVHPQYRYDPITDALYDDIALIQLSVPLYHQVSPGVIPICYAKNNAANYYGQVTATGWGLNSYQVPSNILQFTNLNMITTQMCINDFPGLVQLGNKLCTYTPATGTWMGDSGGPIVAQVSPGSYVQIGIVSFGNAARPDLYPDVYTKVSSYATWICLTSGIC